jgi:hypothetical protein
VHQSLLLEKGPEAKATDVRILTLQISDFLECRQIQLALWLARSTRAGKKTFKRFFLETFEQSVDVLA